MITNVDFCRVKEYIIYISLSLNSSGHVRMWFVQAKSPFVFSIVLLKVALLCGLTVPNAAEFIRPAFQNLVLKVRICLMQATGHISPHRSEVVVINGGWRRTNAHNFRVARLAEHL